jgi:hypothetical protein
MRFLNEKGTGCRGACECDGSRFQSLNGLATNVTSACFRVKACHQAAWQRASGVVRHLGDMRVIHQRQGLPLRLKSE